MEQLKKGQMKRGIYIVKVMERDTTSIRTKQVFRYKVGGDIKLFFFCKM